MKFRVTQFMSLDHPEEWSWSSGLSFFFFPYSSECSTFYNGEKSACQVQGYTAKGSYRNKHRISTPTRVVRVFHRYESPVVGFIVAKTGILSSFSRGQNFMGSPSRDYTPCWYGKNHGWNIKHHTRLHNKYFENAQMSIWVNSVKL